MFSGFFNNLLLVSAVILLGGVIGFFMATRLLRLWVKKIEHHDRRGGDFDMAELFDLYRQGKLTADEYARAREAVLSRSSRWAAEPPETEGKRGFSVIPTEGRSGTLPPPAT